MTEPRACRVVRLRLFQFRNYAAETVDLGPGLNVISGRNAQGKTNLLEAVATLSLTRSPRAAAPLDLLRWGEAACRVEATVHRPDGTTVLEMRLTRVADGEHVVRSTSVDGKARAARALLGVCPVVLFGPDDLLLVKGGPEARRRLLDVLLSQLDPAVATELVRYRRALEQRNAVLRQRRTGPAVDDALAGFTRELVRSGGIVRVARLRLTGQLAPLARAALAELSAGGDSLELRYRAAGGEISPAATENDAADALADELARGAVEELARGLTLFGPHRDDVDILLGGRPARTAASQGQQRSAVLACKLAEVRHLTAATGCAPVLLLDDVLSELDVPRRIQLLETLLAGHTCQALLTTTEDAPSGLPGEAPVHRLAVVAGRVHPAPSLAAGGTAA